MDLKERIVFRRGKKVILRPTLESDLQRCLVWFNDPDVTQYISLTFPLYEQEERELLTSRHKEKEKDIVLAIETLDGVHVGGIGLHRISWPNRTAWLGITIGDKKYWSQGYGTDAIMTLLDYAFNSLNLRKVCLAVLGFNNRGIACYQKCGFKVYGRARSQHYRRGRYCDEVLMEVFRPDWLKIWKSYSPS